MTVKPLLFLIAFLLAFVSGKTEGRENDLAVRQTVATGDTQCSAFMCISATVNGSDVTYVMQSKGNKPLGWMGMGFGRTMANTPMVIVWPNSDGTITLSQRSARSRVMPTVDSNPPRVATLSNSLSSTSGTQPKFAYTIPKNSDTTQYLIYAYGTTNPSSSAVDARIVQHLDNGQLVLDLTKSLDASASSSAANPASTGGSTPGSGSNNGNSSRPTDDIPLTPYQRLIVAHAIFCTVGFLFLLPAGALLARYLRTFTPTWFTGHWVAQFAIAGPVILIGVAMGIQSIVKGGGEHFNDDHKRWGLAIFILYLAQCSLGAMIHFVKPKPSSRRPPQNYIHATFGLLIIALALYQVRTGYIIEWPSKTARGEISNGVDITWHIWVVLLPCLYALGLALLPRQFRQERAKRHLYADDSDERDRFNLSIVQHKHREYQM